VEDVNTTEVFKNIEIKKEEVENKTSYQLVEVVKNQFEDPD
jgi:hypothetical protein